MENKKQIFNKLGLICFFIAVTFFSVGCSPTPEGDAKQLASIIDKHHGKTTKDEACKEAGFDTERCEKANSIMVDAMVNRALK